ETKRIYVESALESQMIGDAIYGLPKAVETQILFYNKELIEESDLPQTTDEWYELSQEFNTSEQFAFLALWDQLYYAGGVIDAYGGYIFGQNVDGDYDPQDIGLNNDGAAEAAEYIQQFYADGIFPSGIVGEQGVYMFDALFSECKAAAVMSQPSNVDPFTADGEYDPEANGLNNDGVVEVAEYIEQLYADGIFPSGIVGEQGINMLDALFIEGKAAAEISEPWNVEPFTSAAIHLGVTESPLF